MKLINKVVTDPPGLNIKQKRSKKTYEALIKAGFRLLKKREWDLITVAELAGAAGYSVGAFYARFKSKDELLDALAAHHRKVRNAALEHLFSFRNNDNFIDELIKDIVHYHWNNRNFWRTAQMRGMRDTEFWEPIRQAGHDVANMTIEIFSKQAGRSLTDEEEINVRFAFQITFGTINNSIINRPGPIFMNQKLFVEKLTRAFRLMSDCDKFKTKKNLKRDKEQL
ncbi:MAG: TetR/AcrR family transcriptional regulator [Deltaproteobacteria bacterium]|nr:TetR/AcrR family transcriptional regulator [Deltaproteobacteria bacterium]